MLDRLKRDLGENFKPDDDALLMSILKETTETALNIANRTYNNQNIDLLSSEITKACKALYLTRGSEGLRSLNESGRVSSFNDIMEQLRNDIIRNGKRLLR